MFIWHNALKIYYMHIYIKNNQSSTWTSNSHQRMTLKRWTFSGSIGEKITSLGQPSWLTTHKRLPWLRGFGVSNGTKTNKKYLRISNFNLKFKLAIGLLWRPPSGAFFSSFMREPPCPILYRVDPLCRGLGKNIFIFIFYIYIMYILYRNNRSCIPVSQSSRAN